RTVTGVQTCALPIFQLALAQQRVEEAHRPLHRDRGRGPRRGALELRLDALERGDPLLDRRVRREDVVERVLRSGGEDVESVHLEIGRASWRGRGLVW